MQLKLNNDRDDNVVFQPSFHKKQVYHHKTKSSIDRKPIDMLTFDERNLIFETQFKKKSNIQIQKQQKEEKRQTGKSLPIFNNQILLKEVSKIRADNQRGKDSLFKKIDAGYRLPLQNSDIDSQMVAPRKMSIILKQQDLPYEINNRKGAKVHFVKNDISHIIIEEDYKHQQQQQGFKLVKINGHPTKQIMPLFPIGIDRNSYLSRKKQQRTERKNLSEIKRKRVSVSLPSIQNRIDREEQLKIQLICKKQDELPSEAIHVTHTGKNEDRKIIIKKVSKKRRLQMIGHKRVNTDPHQGSSSIVLVSSKKKMTLKYEEQLKYHYKELSKLYTQKNLDQNQTEQYQKE